MRDELAGGRADDWDLTTAARPTDVQRIFRRTVPLGVDHGTVGVIAKGGKMYEVTTFRRDVETDGRRARVAFSDTVEEDLERRDFTINAIAWHPLTHRLLDPHGGRDDLRSGVLRTVGDPARRFEEDRLRVLRALRFAGRFGLQIDSATWQAARDCAARLDNLSAERIREELWKVVSGQRRPSTSLRLYGQSGVLAALFPELEQLRSMIGKEGPGAWAATLEAVDAVAQRRPIVRLAALLHQVARPEGGSAGAQPGESEGAARSAAIARQLLLRIRSSNADTDRITHLIAQHEALPRPESRDPELLRWIRLIGTEYVNDLLRLAFALKSAGRYPELTRADLRRLHRRIYRIIKTNPPVAIGDLAIDGTDLRRVGIAPGPRYGEILRDLLERVTDDPSLNSPERLLAIVRSEFSFERNEGGGSR